MLRQIWQWLKNLFGRLFGGGSQSAISRHSSQSSYPGGDSPAKPLDDSDLEYLFRQLLEGLAHGWQQERVVRWFESMKPRVPYSEWVEWLRRFGERVVASPAPNNELAARLVQLGEQTLSVPSLQPIGEVAYSIGMQLLDRNPGEPIWEFDGPDALPQPLPDQGEEQVSQGTEEAETITLDELFGRMQQDPNLVQLLAQQVGIETTDPQVIINAIINQFNASNQVATNEAGDWFNQGVQQDQSEDFEGAIASYNQALEIQPDLYEAWFNKGNVFAKLGRFEEAIAAYDKSIEFKPDLHEAWHNRGNVLSNLGRLDEANASFNKAQEIKGS